MTAPLVSVCMTTYNHAPYLAQAIESVLAQQTPFDVELVLGEDCSTDATATICRDYATRYPDRIRLITSAVNVGWRANYRRTIAACRGRYVAILDGDDWWSDPHKLRLQVEALEENPRCGMCFTRTERLYPEQGGRRELFPPRIHTDFARMVVFNAVDNCCAMAHRELIERYYAEVRPEEHPEWLTDDTPMWLWFAATSGMCFVDRVTAVHRVLTGSVSHGDDYRKQLAFNDSIWEINCWFDAHYGQRRQQTALRRTCQTQGLWLLAHKGTVGEFMVRWLRDVTRRPRLLLNIYPYGLFVKRLFVFQRKR